MARVRRALARARTALASPSRRGPGFWLVTVLLGLVLPAPVALAVVVARFRRLGSAEAPRAPGL
jgi:hypothetical protein